jgi:hypothetical protein
MKKYPTNVCVQMFINLKSYCLVFLKCIEINKEKLFFSNFYFQKVISFCWKNTFLPPHFTILREHIFSRIFLENNFTK